MRRRRFVLVAASLSGALLAQGGTVRIGAKNFTESAVLAELMAQVVEAHTDLVVDRRTNLGGTMLCWTALTAGEIDVYAEYTGTAWAAILRETTKVTDPLRVWVEVERRSRDEHGVRWLAPFGFENSYALAMRESHAERLGVRRISDLIAHQGALRAGFGVEFGSRADGYPGLAETYGLQLGDVRTVEHALAYDAMARDAIDVMDAYTTDGKLLQYGLRVLEDDRRFFPPYHAAPVVREAALRAHPELAGALERLAFAVSAADATALNHRVEQGRDAAEVVREFLVARGIVTGAAPTAPGTAPRGRAAMRLTRLPVWLWQHLSLAFGAVLLAVAFAVPLGVVVASRPRLRRVVLAAASVGQTIPGLALLAFMIPLLGLDVRAAIAALFLYSLLPILRNTCTGVVGVAPDLVDAARGMGMRPGQVLRRVQLPLAMPTILAGVRIAAVTAIGTATLAAFLGAGGLGEPILEGLYLNDAGLILLGAVPAALLAVLADAALGLVERRLDPRRRRRGAG